jgi:hypothetical protein
MTMHRPEAVQNKLDQHWLRLPLLFSSKLPPLLLIPHTLAHTQQGNQP